MKRFTVALLFLFWLARPIASFAGDNNSFSNSLKRIVALKNDSARFKGLLELEAQIGEATALDCVDFDKALLETRIKLKDDSGIIVSHLNLGYSYSALNRFNEALYQFLTAMPLAAAQKNYSKQADLLLGASFVYRSLGERSGDTTELHKAMILAQSALNLSRHYDLTVKEAVAYGSIANIYDVAKMHAKAIPFYRKGIAICQKAGAKGEMLSLFTNLGICLKNSHQYEAALAEFNKALLLNDTAGSEVGKIIIHNNIAILYGEMGRLKDAESLALQVLIPAREQDLDPVKIDMYQLLSKVYHNMGRDREALEYANQLILLKDTVLNNQKTQQIAEMQARFNSDVKDKEILEKDAAIAISRRQTTFMWIVLALLSAIAFIIFASRQRTERLNRQIIRQQSELLVQQGALQDLNDMKDRLFSLISHDLRAPVNTLLSFTVLLSEKNIPEEKTKQYLKSLNQILTQTTGLLENLLNFARSEIDKREVKLQPLQVHEITEEVVELMKASLEAKTLRVVNRITADKRVIANEDMLLLVMRNLLGNAAKFSFPGKSIFLDAVQKGNLILISVMDEGAGLSEEFLEDFNREENVLLKSTQGTAQEKGTGLGLMLSRTFLKKMNGRLRAEKNENGACFVVELNVA